MTSQVPNISVSYFCWEVTNIDYLLFLLQVLLWKNQRKIHILQLRSPDRIVHRINEDHSQDPVPQNHIDHVHLVIDHVQDLVILEDLTGKTVIGLIILVPIALAPTPHEHVNILQEDILPVDLRMSKLQTC